MYVNNLLFLVHICISSWRRTCEFARLRIYKYDFAYIENTNGLFLKISVTLVLN